MSEPAAIPARSPLALSRRTAACCGVLGPLLLVLYFGAPAFTGWPYAGASPERLAGYAATHAWLFYAGAWLQVTGTLLSLVFFLALLMRANAQGSGSGQVLVVTGGSLLAVVLVEAACLVAVPGAAQAGDRATVAVTFALSNGVFARVFPLAPASGSYVALGAVVLETGVLPRRLGLAAIGLGVAFELAGLLAIVTSAGLYAAIGLSVLQVVWIVWAAIVFGLAPPDRTRR